MCLISLCSKYFKTILHYYTTLNNFRTSNVFYTQLDYLTFCVMSRIQHRFNYNIVLSLCVRFFSFFQVCFQFLIAILHKNVYKVLINYSLLVFTTLIYIILSRILNYD